MLYIQMRKDNLSYKEAFIKQIWVFVILMIVEFLVLYKISPNDTPYKITIFSVFTLCFVSGFLMYTKRVTNKVSCPHCDANLYYLFEQQSPVHLEVNFCPVCGGEVNV